VVNRVQVACKALPIRYPVYIRSRALWCVGSFVYIITYPTITLVNPSPWSKRLSSTNLCYASSILLLLNKEPTYVVLTLDLEDISVSFLHLRALCLVLLQFLQRCIAS
jgi:hypothetical protein